MKFLKFCFFALIVILLQYCETPYDYEVISIDGDTGIIEIEGDDFVIDSVAIGKGNLRFYSAYLTDKTQGISSINFVSDSIRNYRIFRENLNLMCDDKSFNYNNHIKIFIRHKKYHHKNLFVNRDSVQVFNSAVLPCKGKHLELKANRRR